MKKYIFGIFIIPMLILLSCKNPSASAPKPIVTTPNGITDYGNGVYYFNYTQKEFGTSLSYFLSDSSKVLISITGDGTAVDGFDNGYWVVVKRK